MATSEELVADASTRMDKSVEHARNEFNTVRTGRASAGLLDRINVDYYGTATPLKQLATINVPEPRLLTIQPFDPSSIKTIEKAIQNSELGINPSNDGTVIRLGFPPLTQDRRKELIRVARERAEEGKVAVRNVRRHVKDEMEHLEREGQITEDDLRRQEKDLQRVTDHNVAEIDEVLAAKERELLEV